MPKTQWGIAIPQAFIEGPIDMALVRSLVNRGEALGFHSLWVLESPVGAASVLEPVDLLCYAAALTTKVQLGTSVLVSPLRNPAELARTLASLDQMSDGRLIIGVGLGDVERHYPVLGIPTEQLVRRFLEGLTVMKAIWTQPAVTYKGDFWHFEGLQMGAKPVQKPYPPIWFGGGHPNALKRAVLNANGWMGAGASSTAQFKQHVQQIRQYLEEAEREPSTFPIAKRVYIAIDTNRARAKHRLQEWFAKIYQNAAMAEKVAVWGSVDECAEQLAEVTASGAQHIALNPLFDHLEHLELLVEDILPRL